jgi:NAD(P)-dependent dehydrogenase (short-subunit alcohol dehydrogenase family)
MTSATTPVSTQREPELVGQTVVVIGGSAGIGLETARRARSEGADVVLVGRDPERLEQAARDVDARSTAAFDANDATALKGFFAKPTPPAARQGPRSNLRQPGPSRVRFTQRQET